MNAIDVERLKAHAEALPGEPLARLRRDAIESLAETGLPTTRDENFKYTDLAEVVALSDAWLAKPVAPEPSAGADALIAKLEADQGFDWLVIRNGVVKDLLSLSLPSVRFSALSDEADPRRTDTPLAAFNAALLTEGLVIDIEADRERPLALLFIDDAESSDSIVNARVDIRVAEQASAEIVEYYASFGENAHYSNAVLRLDIAKGGNLRHVRIQDRGHRHSLTQSMTVTVGRDASFRSAAFDFGGRLTRNDLVVDLPEIGGHAEFNGLYLSGDGQHVDNHTKVDHRVGPASSRQEYRGILFGHSRAVWNGKALVYEGADGTDAEQSNHNLLLSENAEIDTKPELEIYAEDVRCSHGTTVGQLDERALFYLRSRGIDADEGRRLLVKAFAAETVNSLPVAAATEHLHELLEERLESLDEIPFSQ